MLYVFIFKNLVKIYLRFCPKKSSEVKQFFVSLLKTSRMKLFAAVRPAFVPCKFY